MAQQEGMTEKAQKRPINLIDTKESKEKGL